MGILGLNFGLEPFLGAALYLSGIAALLLSIFWRPQVGLWYITPLIPLQTIRDRLATFPLGKNVVIILLLGVAFGLLRRRKGIFPSTPWSLVLGVYISFTLLSIFTDGGSLTARLGEWKDYMLMPLLLFLTAAAVDRVRDMKFMLLLMFLSSLMLDRSFWNAISERDFSTFSTDLQEGGAMGYAGVQGLAAFNAAFAWFMVALAGGQTRRSLRWACFGLALFAANCVMYTFSRGAYVGFLAGWLAMGFAKYRSLLVILALFLATWATVVPPAVEQRITMTYNENGEVDHSAQLRLELWAEAMELFHSSPIIGSGFNTYAHMEHPNGYADSHNIYLKVLVETGVVGMAIFLWLIFSLAWAGFRVFRTAEMRLVRSLGLGLAVWVLCAATSSCFGDRWTYLQINGYMWIVAGFVARRPDLEEAETAEANVRLSDTTLAPALGI